MKVIIKTKVLIYCALFGVVVIIAGVVLGYRVFPSIVEQKVWENVILKENTRQWDLFKKIPFAFDFKVYFFDVQNTEEILQGQKPVVKEVGPYVYKLLRWKDNITVDEDEISYYDMMHFEFDQKASGSLSDEDAVTILNSPFNALILTVEELSPGLLATVDEILPEVFSGSNGLFATAKVKDWLFDGLTLCHLDNGADFATKMICDQLKAKTKITKAMTVVGNSVKYSYLNFKNHTELGRLTINSGMKVKEHVSNLMRYNNVSFVSAWKEESGSCNNVKSTTTFRPFLTKDMRFDAFSEDICRRMTMAFDSVNIVKGVDGYKFVAVNNSFDAPNLNKDNSCYCINKSRTLDGGYGCLKSGVLDLSNCIGAPVLLSFPHLLYGDQEYLATVDGLHPDPNKHETYVVLEPISGTPLKLAKRVQFNMFMRAVPDITSIENITNAIVPILWVEESLTLGDQYIDLIKTSLLNNLLILDMVKWVLIGLGISTILISAALVVCKNDF